MGLQSSGLHTVLQKNMKAFLVLCLAVGLGSALSIQNPQLPQNSNWLNVFIQDLKRSALPDPPPYFKYAKMARYIMHVSDWTSMATFSVQMPGYPKANVFSVSDGTLEKSSGIPYFYLSDMEISVHDLAANNKASITMSLAQGDYCKKNNLDPEDPLCAHLILTGKVVTLDENSDEYKFAHEGLFSRHAEMSQWPSNHGWTVRKLDIENIMLLDYFGGVKFIDIDEYLKETPF